MGELVVLPPGQLTLFDLATIANREHALAFEAGVSFIEHAIRAGEALLEAKAQIRHGEWLPWLAKNFDASEDTAERYMKVASNSARVRNLEEPTLRKALEALSPPDLDPTMAVMSSSASPEWATPQDVFDELDAEFGFELDVCATDENAKCARYFTQVDDGLAQEWTGRCWMNPPYGDTIGAWVRKARESAMAGAVVVCLVPARVDTAWWWDNCWQAEIRFIRGRLRFGAGDVGAPFPSAIVVFGLAPNIPSSARWVR